MFRPTATEFLERLELASKVKRKRKLTDSKEEKKPSKKDCDFKFYSKESFKLRFTLYYLVLWDFSARNSNCDC